MAPSSRLSDYPAASRGTAAGNPELRSRTLLAEQEVLPFFAIAPPGLGDVPGH
jgi:hypothetical protein